jgi:hypothetical protein
LTGNGKHIPWPPRSPHFTPLDFPPCGFVKDNVYREEVQNVNELRGRIVRTADCITNEMLANTWQKLNIALMCAVPLMVPILTSAEHIRNFVKSQCLEMYRFLQYTL